MDPFMDIKPKPPKDETIAHQTASVSAFLLSYLFTLFCVWYHLILRSKKMEGRRVVGWAARDASGILSPYSFTLRFLSVLFISRSLILTAG